MRLLCLYSEGDFQEYVLNGGSIVKWCFNPLFCMIGRYCGLSWPATRRAACSPV